MAMHGNPAPEPPSPWSKHSEWAAGRIVEKPQLGTPVLVLTGLFFGLPGAALMAHGLPELLSSPGDGLVTLTLGILMLGLFGGLLAMWLRYRKFGPSECMLETIPGVIGGEFCARVEARLPVRPASGVSIRLFNASIAGKSIVVHWETTSTVPPMALEQVGLSRLSIPVRVPIPADVPHVEGSFWKLEVRAALPGLDYQASFTVPVFRAPASGAQANRGAPPRTR